MKTANGKKLQLKTLVNSEYAHTRINKQLVKKEKIKIELIDESFKIFNTDRTKNGEVTRFIPLELEIDRYMEIFYTAVTDLNSIDMFLRYNWLVKHNPDVNWNKGMIQFIRCLKECKIEYQDIVFTSRTRRMKPMKETDKEHWKIYKQPDSTNSEDLLEYI